MPNSLMLAPFWVAATLLTSLVAAQSTDPELTGTWTTKSRKVVTGPVRQRTLAA